MKYSILSPDDYRQMPWKNGQGVTCEIIREPVGDDQPFHWRVSIADIKENGPFSFFPEYRRIINTLEGQGMVLTVDGLKTGPLTKYQPFVFEGESRVESELIDGPISDFNLIYRRDLGRARFQWLRVDEPQIICTQSARILIFSVGHLRITADKQSSFDLGRYYTLAIENTGQETARLIVDSGRTESPVYCCLMEIDIQS